MPDRTREAAVALRAAHEAAHPGVAFHPRDAVLFALYADDMPATVRTADLVVAALEGAGFLFPTPQEAPVRPDPANPGLNAVDRALAAIPVAATEADAARFGSIALAAGATTEAIAHRLVLWYERKAQRP